MNPSTDVPVFREDLHQLTVIHTDLAEAETLLRTMAEQARQQQPRAFAGLTPCVYFKMPYVQPFDTFRALRSLILRIHENTGLRANFKGIVAIEATQWLGHEQEEYFTVFLKFLADHLEVWQIALVLNGCTSSQLQRFLCACGRYMTPHVVERLLFRDKTALQNMIQAEFQRKNVQIIQEAAALCAEAMIRPEFKQVRSLSFIERTLEEIHASNGRRPLLTAGKLKSYLRDPNTGLALMAGKPLYNERQTIYEK